MSIFEVKVPDIGDFQDVEVVEVICKEGQAVKVEDSLITLESDKATMDVPSPLAGRIISIKLKSGDKVSEGNLILELEPNGESELEAQKLPLGLSSSTELLDKTQIAADKNENPPEPEITKLKLPSSGWSVQVGSFPTLEEAEESIATLSEKNIEAYYVVALINNKNWYRVRVGGYNSKSLAVKGKTSLSNLIGGKDYIVRKVP